MLSLGDKKYSVVILAVIKESWRAYDASELVKQVGYHSPILIDQGTADQVLTEQLMPEVFEQACADVKQPLNLRYQEGYDHGFYFISQFY